MKNHIIPSFLVVALVCFAGCGGPQRPADLPDLYPVRITVVQDGQPLEGATVIMMAEDTPLRFAIAGITNSSGVATIHTDIDWPGAPAGRYLATVRKVVAPTADMSLDYEAQQAAAAAAAGQTRSLVNSKYLRFNTTDLRVEVTSSGATATFDVGPAVDELWDNVAGGSSAN